MNLDLLKGSRSRILAGLLIVVAAIIIMRLFYLQIIRHDYYMNLANQEQVKQLTIPAKRGLIYAMNGDTPERLVLNEKVYTLFADPVVVDEPDAVITTIREIAGGNARENLSDMLANKKSRYQILATKLTRTQADKIKEKGLKGIGFQEVSQRVYPEGGLAGQLLGFVDANGDGKYGIEGGLDARLKGKDGLLQSVTDVSSVPLTIGNKNINIPAQNGDNVVLSIDRNVQSKVEQALASGMKRSKATYASAIVVNPQNGQVVAMANLPSYSPATFSSVDDAGLFNNNTISGPYEPGSVMKTFTLATGVDVNAIRPTDTFRNYDTIWVDDKPITNVTKGFNRVIDYQTVLNHSLNTGTVEVAKRLGDGKRITEKARETMYDYFHNKFRLGQETDIELDGELPGQIVPPNEVEGNAVRYSNMTFGQGLDVTMLQVAAGFSAMVNGGKYYQPTVLAGTMSATGTFEKAETKQPSQIIKKSTSDTMRSMVYTARQSTFPGQDKAGYEVGGKTGTSQTYRNGEYVFDQTIASYLGYGGGSSPRYVIMVEIFRDGRSLQGGIDAMPIFTEISNWMIDYLKLQPKG